VPVITVI
jgi:hypothetical protein